MAAQIQILNVFGRRTMLVRSMDATWIASQLLGRSTLLAHLTQSHLRLTVECYCSPSLGFAAMLAMNVRFRNLSIFYEYIIKRFLKKEEEEKHHFTIILPSK
jgi:hypothetical protein